MNSKERFFFFIAYFMKIQLIYMNSKLQKSLILPIISQFYCNLMEKNIFFRKLYKNCALILSTSDNGRFLHEQLFYLMNKLKEISWSILHHFLIDYP